MRIILLLAVVSLGSLSIHCGEKMISQKVSLEAVKQQVAKFAPVELACDLSSLPASEKKALAKLAQAALLIDELFLTQVDPQNPRLQEELQPLAGTAEQPYLDLFTIMFGPWNRIDHDRPFLNTAAKPQGAGFYPTDMSKEEFERHLEGKPQDKPAFENSFTVIRRVKGELVAMPYHLAYQPLVGQIAQLLEEAADETMDPALEKFLRLRSKAFLNDDYYASDMAWMDLNGPLEIVIGPYEVYEDNLFNYKAAYEAFLCIVDRAESEKLNAIAAHLIEMEKNLPIDDRYKNFNRGASSPIKVVQEVFAAGDTKSGVQTAAFNLPNDERVREAKGSKKVMLKNVMRAKFDKCWMPIASTVLAPRPLSLVSFDAYFDEVLMHEVSHGLGPGMVTLPNGERTDVAKLLKELYSVVEECKADVLGVINCQFLMTNGVFPADMESSLYATYLGGMLRSIRFGISEAHGGGVAIQFNYCMEEGAVTVNEDGKLDMVDAKMLPTLRSLAAELLIIQATGDYRRGKEFIDRYRIVTPAMQSSIDRLVQVPVDIWPSYPVMKELAAE
jgi:hypothetical protein